jgi:hypothetical protein
VNFVELQNEVITFRFREGQRTSVGRWINLRYQGVNAQADWPWLYPHMRTLAWPGGSSPVPLLGSDRRLSGVYDDSNDVPLAYLPYEQFQEMYGDSATDGGDPAHYTIHDSGTDAELLLGPLGSPAVSLKLIGETRPAELVAATDEPLWPEHWHYSLVLGASSTGLKLENDPTWEALETEFLANVLLMKEEVLPPHQPEPRQFGRVVFE